KFAGIVRASDSSHRNRVVHEHRTHTIMPDGRTAERGAASMSIHPSSVLSAEAEISPEAEIGPFCLISGRVRIGAGTVVESHVRIGSRFGSVSIGERNLIQSGAMLGGPPQDLSYEQLSDAALVIGDDNRIGEYVTINLGTRKGGGTTRLGNG